ncbi:MAG TPA: 50S ribosomal protein L17 [Planctomycetaceae bacterium]|nr:50S ribosomal protein L17 [Planctomycetaceae bacterium]
MRHRCAGRKLGRNASHRKAMFRNMAVSLIRTLRSEEGAVGAPRVAGRIVTTVAKAKELRPFVEKLVTMGRKGWAITASAAQYRTTAERGSDEWKQWRDSDAGRNWVRVTAPALALRRRAFSALRDEEAVDILFNELAERFSGRNGGYTRIVRMPVVRLGDAGQQAMIEFVGSRDRVNKSSSRSAPAVDAAE